jgi:hypothetical protein
MQDCAEAVKLSQLWGVLVRICIHRRAMQDIQCAEGPSPSQFQAGLWLC